MDRLTPEQRSKNMKAIKSSGTKAEILFAKALFTRGYRYRKNSVTVYGKPDISIKKLKLAIFIDGEFWHGKEWETKKSTIGTNTDFWHKKIERNMERDKEVNEKLRNEGWTVLRFWDKEVMKELEKCIGIVVVEISRLRGNRLGMPNVTKNITDLSN